MAKMELNMEPGPQFKDMLLAMDVQVDFEETRSRRIPQWIDFQLYERGRKIFLSNPIGIYFSNYRNLVTGLAIPNLW